MTILPDNVLTKMSPADRKRLGRAGITSDEAQAKMDYRLERELQSQIMNDLVRRGFPVLSNRTNKRHTGKKGQPDLMIFAPNNLLLMELKRAEDGKLSDAQIKLHAALKSTGYTVHVVTSFTQYLGLIKGGVGK